MARKKMQSDKALYSDKKIWSVQIYITNTKKDIEKNIKHFNEMCNEGRYIQVYVVDISMARAIKKAVYYFGRKTGIKSMNIKESYDNNRLTINVRRATKIEIVKVRAGTGIKVANRYKAMDNGLEVI